MSLVGGYSTVKAGAPFRVIQLYGQVTFGASGAVTTDSVENGAWSVARTAAGRYTITTTELYAEMLMANFILDSQGTMVDGVWEVFTPYSTSDKTVVFSHVVSGSEADPTSGNIVNIALTFKVSDL